MILAVVLSVIFAVAIDLALGDPKNKYHPTAWIGAVIGRLIPYARSDDNIAEKLGGTLIVVSIAALAGSLAYFSGLAPSFLNYPSLGIPQIIVVVISLVVTGLLLKSTIAIKGMQEHASRIMESLSKDDLEGARSGLSMIVKRNTKNLDRQHIISATLESISENIVDGITGPLFYFAFFGLAGSFIYRTINTADSMVGYKNNLFRNVGWFGANCDKVLNFVPSRLTSMIMILSGMIVGLNWRHSVEIMKRDGSKTESPNAGYPMATMAGALGVKFEKIDHYVLGDGSEEFTERHFRKAVLMMKITAFLFAGLFTIPLILLLSYLGWWNFA